MFIILATALLLHLIPDPCEKVQAPKKGEVWKFDKIWNYSPFKISKNEICQSDLQEFFYIKQRDKASYIAMKKVKITKESSCKNNSLFNGKQKLFREMLETTLESNPILNSNIEKKILIEIAQLNNKIEHAGTYDCVPLNTKNVHDPDAMWEECECILYGYFIGGKEGLAKRLKK